MIRTPVHELLAMMVFPTLLLGVTPAPVSAAQPPANKTYFTLLLGVSEPYFPSVDCLTFSSSQICIDTGACGPWTRTESGPDGAFSFEIEYEDEDGPVLIAGQARSETRGKKDSIGGAVRTEMGGQTFNLSFAGKSTNRRKCAQLLSQWEAGNTQGPCGEYPDWRTSPYILPYEVGASFEVVQGNCSSPYSNTWNSHQSPGPWMFSYDFLMPIGTSIVAARGGRVIWVVENHPDVGGGGNALIIDHGDGTFAGYGHLTFEGALVEVDQQVEQGDIIALSGTSGSDIPHLHFHVGPCTNVDIDGCTSLPVTFRNTKANPRGLIRGRTYEALPD